jgi:hypothetical protein
MKSPPGNQRGFFIYRSSTKQLRRRTKCSALLNDVRSLTWNPKEEETKMEPQKLIKSSIMVGIDSNVNLEDIMIGNGIKYRPFPFWEGEGG